MGIDSKFHHLGVQSTRVLKRVAALEAQKIGKRTKKDQIDRTLELQASKAIDCNVLATYYLRRQTKGELRKTLGLEDEIAPYRDSSTEEKNVIGRLFKAKVFQQCITDGIAGLESALGITVPSVVHADLPVLRSGFIPASDSEESIEEDTSRPPVSLRKNRRGQRERRKIMELKHGRNANHLVKERKIQKEEYEERIKKRAEKEVSAVNKIELAERKRREFKEKSVHESWIAARKLKDAMKGAKPTGQKIVFD